MMGVFVIFQNLGKIPDIMASHSSGGIKHYNLTLKKCITRRESFNPNVTSFINDSYILSFVFSFYLHVAAAVMGVVVVAEA